MNKSKQLKPKIIMCGGHHTSSLPIIDNILSDGRYEIIFVGRRRAFSDDKNDSLEFIDINKRKIKFYDLKTGKFYGKSFLSWFKVLCGFFDSLKILLIERPKLIVSFGGYIAVPLVLVGFLLRIKIITHEQTVVTGLGNKVISLFADRILVTWPSSVRFFPENKTKVIGLPLRKSFFEKGEDRFEVNPNLPTIFITCGKTGSHVINEFILNNLNDILQNFNLIHQAGDYSVTNDYSNLVMLKESLGSKALGKYHLFKFMFESEVKSAFQTCDFLVSRSGAHTTYEILHFKKKAILIPISWVSHNEQYLNAKIIYDLGLGLILEESALNWENFLLYTKKILLKEIPDSTIKKELVVKDSEILFLNEIEKLCQK
jgi:UDP-N-acetylglucosamine--N-acetylmuramyl-(pentapeptide) pyrophosphoryl-undecaprenol N-acetylglucosamine transferase